MSSHLIITNLDADKLNAHTLKTVLAEAQLYQVKLNAVTVETVVTDRLDMWFHAPRDMNTAQRDAFREFVRSILD